MLPQKKMRWYTMEHLYQNFFSADIVNELIPSFQCQQHHVCSLCVKEIFNSQQKSKACKENRLRIFHNMCWKVNKWQKFGSRKNNHSNYGSEIITTDREPPLTVYGNHNFKPNHFKSDSTTKSVSKSEMTPSEKIKHCAHVS